MFAIKCFLLISVVALCFGKQLGYHYEQPHAGLGVPDNQISNYAPPSYGAVPPSYGAAPPSFGGPQYGNYPQPEHGYEPTVTENFNKEFYTFEAPEEDFVDPHAEHQVSSALQKNVRVIFIRTPENRGLEHAALALAKQSSDDKTAIYVLNKQTDVGELVTKLTSIRSQHTHKPEVHFVKYRTPEEASYAQQSIQTHYDALGGTSHSSNEGAAPVLNFASRGQQVSTSTSIGPIYGGHGAGGVPPAGFGGYLGQTVPNSNGIGDYQEPSAVTGPLNTISSNGAYVGYGSDNAVSKINERLSAGANFAFPSEGPGSNTYLPPFKKTH